MLAFKSKGCGGAECTQQGETYREAQDNAPNLPLLLHGGFSVDVSAAQFFQVAAIWHAWMHVYTSWKSPESPTAPSSPSSLSPQQRKEKGKGKRQITVLILVLHTRHVLSCCK